MNKQALLKIYRACRLCGAGAGYKMPIVQNFVQFGGDIDLKRKIYECLQIEVSPNDHMPPLICEVCVDKVCDYYEFLQLCRRTNKQTRMKLGLPLQVKTEDRATDTCMLHVPPQIKTEIKPENRTFKQICKNSLLSIKDKIEKMKANSDWQDKLDKDVQDIEDCTDDDSPKRLTRQNISSDALPKLELKDPTIRQWKNRPGPKSKRIELQTNDDHKSTFKRRRGSDVKENPPPNKKIKSQEQKPLKPGPKSQKNRPIETISKVAKDNTSSKLAKDINASKLAKDNTKSAKPTQCKICGKIAKSSQGLSSHCLIHVPIYTPPTLACNACRDWFPTESLAVDHHSKHTSYQCPRCKKKYKTAQQFDEHQLNKKCVKERVVCDVKCSECWRLFPTNTLYRDHRCLGQDGRPGGKCKKCNRNYTLLKNLVKHESMCTFSRKGRTIISPSVKRRLLPMQVRVIRCDDLIRTQGGRYDVSHLPPNFGLDPNSVYPYLSTRINIKTEPQPDVDQMVLISDDIKQEFNQPYVYWDSDSNDAPNTVKTLTNLALKVIFSDKMLGKVPKRRKSPILMKLLTNSLKDDQEYDSDSILDRNSDFNACMNFNLVDNKNFDVNDVGNANDMTKDDRMVSSNDNDTIGDEKATFNDSVNFNDSTINDKEDTNDSGGSNDVVRKVMTINDVTKSVANETTRINDNSNDTGTSNDCNDVDVHGGSEEMTNMNEDSVKTIENVREEESTVETDKDYSKLDIKDDLILNTDRTSIDNVSVDGCINRDMDSACNAESISKNDESPVETSDNYKTAIDESNNSDIKDTSNLNNTNISENKSDNDNSIGNNNTNNEKLSDNDSSNPVNEASSTEVTEGFATTFVIDDSNKDTGNSNDMIGNSNDKITNPNDILANPNNCVNNKDENLIVNTNLVSDTKIIDFEPMDEGSDSENVSYNNIESKNRVDSKGVDENDRNIETNAGINSEVNDHNTKTENVAFEENNDPNTPMSTDNVIHAELTHNSDDLDTKMEIDNVSYEFNDKSNEINSIENENKAFNTTEEAVISKDDTNTVDCFMNRILNNQENDVNLAENINNSTSDKSNTKTGEIEANTNTEVADQSNFINAIDSEKDNSKEINDERNKESENFKPISTHNYSSDSEKNTATDCFERINNIINSINCYQDMNDNKNDNLGSNNDKDSNNQIDSENHHLNIENNQSASERNLYSKNDNSDLNTRNELGSKTADPDSKTDQKDSLNDTDYKNTDVDSKNDHLDSKIDQKDSLNDTDHKNTDDSKNDHLDSKTDQKDSLNDTDYKITDVDPKNDHSDSKIDRKDSLNDTDYKNTDVDSKNDNNSVEARDKFNFNDLSEDDKRLMADLDEQIGYDESSIKNDKSLKNNDFESLDLDKVSDEEFNFDD